MFYDNRRNQHHNDISELSNLRTNVYNVLITNTVTKQFEEVHGSDFKPVLNQNHMSDEEGLKRAYDSPNRYYQHRNKLFIAGTKDFPQDLYRRYEITMGEHIEFNKTRSRC